MQQSQDKIDDICQKLTIIFDLSSGFAALIILVSFAVFPVMCQGQVLFLEECFEGGATGAGFTATPGSGSGVIEIRLEDGAVVKSAYAITHRYGRPPEWSFGVNNSLVTWNMDNQVGPELESSSPDAQNFAVHLQNITNNVLLDNNLIEIEITNIPSNPSIPNEGWWSIYIVVLYVHESITDPTCLRIYTADERQDEIQSYVMNEINYLENTDVGFAIYTDRLSNFYSDRSRVNINNTQLGMIFGADASNPNASVGTRGHFYYENGELFGLDDDVPNTTISNTDAIAVINEYLVPNNEQSIEIYKVQGNPNIFGNAHPAFFIAYTPECPVSVVEMPRYFTLCRGDTIYPEAAPGYDFYVWEPSIGLSDPAIANPLCTADISRWYRVRMWNEDDAYGCPQTIPVFVEVNPLPAPESIQITPSSCPGNSGRISLLNSAGTPPFQYYLNGVEQASSVFQNLAPDAYHVSTTDAQGCIWDSTVTVPLNTPQTAAFTPNPSSGETPLYVYFSNQSTNATGYEWLIDGLPFSTSFNTAYTFVDSGYFEVSLVAWLDIPSCADTATYMLRVDPGIKVAMPNIITPNGDGRNDHLVAQLFGVSRLSWQIFNRWGQPIAAGSDTSGSVSLELWDARAGGEQVSDGIYQITLVVEGLTGKVEQMQFQVTVVN